MMHTFFLPEILSFLAFLLPGVTPGGGVPLEAVPFSDVVIQDEFWSPRLEANRAATLPHVFEQCEETGRIDNFQKAAGLMEGAFEGYFFNDSDVYKALEGAAYLYALAPGPELDALMDAVIAKIAAAQEEDGYINSFYSLTAPDKKWTDLANKHELYCGGHLIEAGIAHFEATGKRSLLDIAMRFAELVDSMFGPEKRWDVPGHEEIELALVKLHRLTGEQRWLDLALFFVEARGRSDRRTIYGEYCQDHLPVDEQAEIAGHAVRAMYLYAAVTDLAAAIADTALASKYAAVLDRIWRDVTERKMYITGGIGPSAHNEGFTQEYDLPNDTAYAETCASIGLVFWAHRMNLLHADARYADVMERSLYNGLLSGVSLDGTRFFYTNPLGSRGDRERVPWYDCACCPPNVLRLIASLGGYAYAHSGDSVYVNLYIGGKAAVRLAAADVTLTQTTRYPREGRVRIEVGLGAEREGGGATAFAVKLRIPDWCEAAAVAVNGEPHALDGLDNGYARIHREWKDGDVIELDLPMPVRRVAANPKVAQTRGRVAIQRGPLVYCLEGADNGGRVRHLVLPPDAELAATHLPDLLGGVTAVTGRALAAAPVEWDGRLYAGSPRLEAVTFTAVPYYAWANRGQGEMVVWLPESPALVEPSP